MRLGGRRNPSRLSADAILPPTAGLTWSSERRARDALAAAIDAVGGLDRLEAIRTVFADRAGHLHLRNQSPRPEGPWLALARRGWDALDLAAGAAASEREGCFAGGYVDHVREVFAGGSGIVLDLHVRTVRRAPGMRRGELDAIERTFPPLALLAAWRRAPTLRWLGEEARDGRRLAAVSFHWEGAGTYSLLLDAESRLPVALETLTSDRTAGDAVYGFLFDDWRPVDGVLAPFRLEHRRAGETTAVFASAQVAVDRPLDPALFAVPAGFVEAEPAAGGPSRLTRLADDVWLIEGLGGRLAYNALAVGFEREVVVVEAPLASSVGEEVLARAAEAMPGRPVTTLALTHHHDDHSGGTRPFVAAGATILTTAGNVDYLRAMAAAPRTFHPDRLAREPREPAIEVVRGRRALDDGRRRLELIEVGPSPHVDEMLVAWLPEEGILFQGDLLNVPRGGPVPPAVDTTVHFARKLAELGIAPRVHVGVHGTAGGPEHLAEALERRRRLDAGEDPWGPFG